MQLADNRLVCVSPECKGIFIDKVALAHVHCLRHKLFQTHFCLECGEGFPDEPSAVKHQIMVHRNSQRNCSIFNCSFCKVVKPLPNIKLVICLKFFVSCHFEEFSRKFQ